EKAKDEPKTRMASTSRPRIAVPPKTEEEPAAPARVSQSLTASSSEVAAAGVEEPAAPAMPAAPKVDEDTLRAAFDKAWEATREAAWKSFLDEVRRSQH